MGDYMAIVLGLAASLCLLAVALIGLDPAQPSLRLVSVLALWLGPISLLLLVGLLGRRRLMRWAERTLVGIAGPALIRMMAPRTVLGALLPWIYGDCVSHQDVLTAVLGGAGKDPSGSDTAVSRSTTAHFRLQAIDDQSCLTEATWKHEFSGVRNNHRLVVFATCDQDVLDLVIRERLYPLFEVWNFQDEDQLEEFVPTLRESLKIGISYFDADGSLHEVPPRFQPSEEVALRDYDQFVRLHDGVDRNNIRIVQLDLHDLADPDHVVESVESLSIVASSRNAHDLSYYTWTPPHPCFMTVATFDVSELPRDGEKLAYLVLPSNMKRAAVPLEGGWLHGRDTIEVAVNAWMLPGHGVTLLWRSDD
jgi:hypothetical protein